MVGLLESIALHELAHAVVADLQGDRLPRAMGRVTLNPLRHLDPMGTVLIVLAGFGWGKPVEFRPSALASRRFGAAMVAVAGPLTNFILATAAAFPLVARFNSHDFSSPVTVFLEYFVSVNALLAIFNLLPLPPLDGSRLLTIFLPPNRQNVIYFLDKWGFLILIGLVFLGGTAVLQPVQDHLVGWMLRFAGGG